MYKLSVIVSKQAVELASADILGTVVDVRFSRDLKRAESLLLVGADEEATDDYLSLAVKSISSISELIVVNRLRESLSAAKKAPTFNPINLPCCSCGGEMLGTVSDVELGDDFSVIALVVGEKRFEIGKVLSFSSRLVVVNDGEQDIVLPSPRPKKPKRTAKTKSKPKQPAFQSGESVKITEQVAPKTASAETSASPSFSVGVSEETGVSTPTVAPSPLPSNPAPDFSFLLGKQVKETLYSRGGELIVKEGAIIDESVLERTTKFGRLVQLALRV